MEAKHTLTPSDLDKALKALEEGRFKEATSILEELVEVEGDDPDLLVYLGIAYVQSENPQGAVDVLQRADEMVEEHSVISLFLGRALKALDRLDEAEVELKRTIRLDAEVSEAWFDLANIYYSKREYGLAVEILEESLTLFPNDASLLGLIATCYHRLGDYSAESEQWISLHKIKPNSFFVIWNCAYSLLIQQRTSEAKKYVNLARSMKSEDYHYLLLESELSMQNNDFGKAKELLETVIEKDPKCVPGLTQLAVIAHREQSIGHCHTYVEKVQIAMDENPRMWWALQYIFSRLGWDSHLINCLLRGTKEDIGAAGPWVELAKVYSRKGMWEEAYPAWIKSFELRKYVKIQCDSCNHTMRIPYLHHIGFDITEQRSCQKCNNIIDMPQGLVVN